MANEEVKPDSVELDKNMLEGDDLLGVPSGFVCPECGGVLSEIRMDNLLRFQCHIGHAFLAESLLASQAEKIEHLLWSTLRMLKEHATLTRQMANEAREQNDPLTAQRFEEQAQQARQRTELIRQLLLIGKVNPRADTPPDL
jgi:two-component system chemotaxis response regulator CheB